MIVELQLDADTFLTSFREQMRKALACELTEDVLDFNPTDSVPGAPFVIVGYTVGKTTLRRAKNPTNVCVHTGAANVTTPRAVKKPEIVQELVVHISWENDLRSANTHKAPTTPITLPLVFELAMDTCGNRQLLCFTYTGLDGLSGDPISQKLGGKIRSTCTWLPVDQVIGSYMPKGMKLINSHLNMTESRKCLAVRMEFWDEKWSATTGDPARALPYWDHFYGNGVIDRLQQGQTRSGWNIFIDHLALTEFVRQTMLDNVSGSSGVTITRQPKAEWFDYVQLGGAKFPGYSRVHVDMEVEKENACYCFTEDLDVSAEITADVYISVPKEDTIRIDLYADVSPNFWDASCCVLTAAAFWPILGFGQMATGKITDWEYMAGLLPFFALIGAIIQVGEAGFEAKGGFVKDEDNEDHAYKEQKLYLPNNPGFGKLSLQGSRPLNDGSSLQAYGLFLWGGMEVFSLPQPVLEDPILEPFCWDKAGRCSKRIAASSRFRLYPVNPQHWALLQVCNARVIDDSLNVYKLEVRREEHGFADLVVTVDFWGMHPDFWKPGKSYPCGILIKTTGGVRIVTLKPLAALSEAQFLALQKQAAFEFVNECYLPRHRLFEELEWPIEELFEQPGLHYVQVRAAGLPPGERVHLVGRRGEELGRFTVDRTGTLLVTALARQDRRSEETGSEDGPALRLRRSSAGPAALPGRMKTLMYHLDPHVPSHGIELRPEIPLEGGHGGHAAAPSMLSKVCPPDALGSPKEMVSMFERRSALQAAALEGIDHREESGRGVLIRQTALEEQGSIRLTANVLALVGSGQQLFVILPGLVEAYDISDAHAPRLALAWQAEGARGAVLFGERLLLWGEPGIWVAEDGPPVRQYGPFTPCRSDAVHGAAVARGRLFVLRGGELCIYDSQLCEGARYDARGAEEIAAAGGFVVLRDREGLRVFDGRSGPPEEAPVHTHCCAPGATRLETPAFSFSGATVYAQGLEGGVLLRLRESGESETVAEYAGPAWFAGVVRAGRTLAYVAEEGRVVRLLEPGRTEQNE